MPLSKKDAPQNARTTERLTTKAEAEDAKEDLIDAGAGAPPSMEDAAEALPEGDEVEKAYKEAMLADTTEEETKAKAKATEASPDAAETPSGGALLAVKDISDPEEQAEAYKREKSARRFGYSTQPEVTTTTKTRK
jgi:hypothetical protein